MSPAAGEVFLETETLRLRRFTSEAIDLLVALDADPEVTHVITGGRAGVGARSLSERSQPAHG